MGYIQKANLHVFRPVPIRQLYTHRRNDTHIPTQSVSCQFRPIHRGPPARENATLLTLQEDSVKLFESIDTPSEIAVALIGNVPGGDKWLFIGGLYTAGLGDLRVGGFLLLYISQ